MKDMRDWRRCEQCQIAKHRMDYALHHHVWAAMFFWHNRINREMYEDWKRETAASASTACVGGMPPLRLPEPVYRGHGSE